MANQAGAGDGRRRVGDTADDAPRLDAVGEPAVGIQGLDAVTIELAAMALKIPPGQTVLDGEHHGVGAEQRPDVVHHRLDLVGLEAEDDQILGAAGAHVAGRLYVAGYLGAAILIGDAQTAFPNCLEVPAAGDEGDILAGQSQLHAQQSTDGTGADDADLHESCPPAAYVIPGTTHQALPVVAPWRRWLARGAPWRPERGTHIIKSWEQAQVFLFLSMQCIDARRE